MNTDILPFDPNSIVPSVTALPDIYQLQEPFISIPPASYNFSPSNGDNDDAFNLKLSILGGSAVGINTETQFLCENIASKNDIHNFGYKVYIAELLSVLTRVEKYLYTDSLGTIRLYMNNPRVGWQIDRESYLYKNNDTKPIGVFNRDAIYGLEDPDYIPNLTVTYFNE